MLHQPQIIELKDVPLANGNIERLFDGVRRSGGRLATSVFADGYKEPTEFGLDDGPPGTMQKSAEEYEKEATGGDSYREFQHKMSGVQKEGTAWAK
jgi:hypothetical protein